MKKVQSDDKDLWRPAPYRLVNKNQRLGIVRWFNFQNQSCQNFINVL